MSVTQNYKTVTFSPDAWIATISAVLTVMPDLRRKVGGNPVAPEFMDYLMSEVAIYAEALDALNAASVLTREDTHGALEGENLQTVVVELNTMRRLIADGAFGSLGILKRLDGIDAALLFLESPK